MESQAEGEARVTYLRWLRWRGQLALGQLLKRIGGAIVDRGWRTWDAATRLYRPEFARLEAAEPAPTSCPHGFRDWDDCPDCCH